MHDLLNALHFFHNDTRIVHLGVSPNTIFVTEENRWLLGGMNFSHEFNDKTVQIFYGNQIENVEFLIRSLALLILDMLLLRLNQEKYVFKVIFSLWDS